MVNLEDALVALRALMPVSDAAQATITRKLDESGAPRATWLNSWPSFALFQAALGPILVNFSVRPLDYTRYYAFGREIWKPLRSPWADETKAVVIADIAARWINNGCDQDVCKLITTWAINVLNLDNPGTAAVSTAKATIQTVAPKAPKEPKPEAPDRT
jgi:hypothetical protein